MTHFALTTRWVPPDKKIAILDMEGELNMNSALEFEEALQELFDRRHYKVILNLAKATYISSAGFGILMSVIKEVRKNRGDIKIANVSQSLYDVFCLLELPGLFHILKSEEDAIGEFR